MVKRARVESAGECGARRVGEGRELLGVMARSLQVRNTYPHIRVFTSFVAERRPLQCHLHSVGVLVAEHGAQDKQALCVSVLQKASKCCHRKNNLSRGQRINPQTNQCVCNAYPWHSFRISPARSLRASRSDMMLRAQKE